MSTAPGPDGTVYGVTQGHDDEPDVLFAMDKRGQVRKLGEARGYTTSLALSKDGSKLYYVPGAHGDSGDQGTPVIEVDTASGGERVIAKLNPLAERELGLTLAGTYNLAIDTKRGRLFVGLNAGKDPDSPWGEVVLAVVSLS